MTTCVVVGPAGEGESKKSAGTALFLFVWGSSAVGWAFCFLLGDGTSATDSKNPAGSADEGDDDDGGRVAEDGCAMSWAFRFADVAGEGGGA
jgi:hypothetical protein